MRAHGGKHTRQTLPDSSEIIEARIQSISFWPQVLRLLLRIFCLLAVAALLFEFVFGVLAVRGNAMYPSIRAGDLLLYFRLDSDYQEDEIVIYQAGGETYVGRVVAVAGQSVNLSEAGALYVDGHERQEAIYYKTDARDGASYPLTVGAGEVFVLSDLRTAGTDSRDFGAIPLKDVRGSVFTLLRRSGL